MANVNARRIEDILTNGITADHYIAGSNITITDNSDGTQTISASGGGGGGGGFTPTQDQLNAMNSGITAAKVETYDSIDGVPTVTSTDNGKILTATYSGGEGTYSWTAPQSYSQQQANWAETDNTSVTFIQNKPNLATVATSGSYNDLSNTPTIPAAQVNSDWNANSGVAEILNKPTIPTKTSQLTNDSGFITSADEVPAVTSTDGGKVLTATYSGGTGSYAWATAGGTAPTAYTTPTVGTGVSEVSGGYVVSNNICTVNIIFKATSTGSTYFTGLPRPAVYDGESNDSIAVVLTMGSRSNASTGGSGIHAYLTKGGAIVKSSEASSSLGSNRWILQGSYLIDTST